MNEERWGPQGAGINSTGHKITAIRRIPVSVTVYTLRSERNGVSPYSAAKDG